MILGKKLGMLGICLLCVQTTAYSEDRELNELRGTVSYDEWKLIRDDKLHNIQTYIKQEEGKRLRSFKLHALLDAPLSTIARVEFDADNYRQWYYSVTESRFLKKISNTEFYSYIRYNSPGALPDRDTTLQTVIQPYNSKTGFMKMTIRSLPGFLPPVDGVVRIHTLDMVARFYPVDAQKTRMEIEGYMDPGGFAPMWAVNFVQRTTPSTTIIGLQRMLKMPKYASTEPYTDYKYME